MKSRHAILILLIFFTAMTAVTWQRWANPVIDGGREMNTPLRLLKGEQLYTEVYYLYGPVAPAFNALLYKIFGVHLRTLYAAGLAGGMLLVLVIYFLGRKFMPVSESLLAAAAVLLLCVFKQRGNMIFPYSYAALYGTLLATLSLVAQLHHVRSNRPRSLIAAGMLSGLVLCCKLEFGFAALASLIALLISSRRGQRLKNAVIASASTAVIPLLIYGFLLTRIPPDKIFADTFLTPGHIPAELLHFNKLKLGLNDPAKTLRELISAVALLCGTAGILSLVAMRVQGESLWPSRLAENVERIWKITIAGWGILALHLLFFGTAWALNPFRAFPVLFIGMIYHYFTAQSRTAAGDAEHTSAENAASRRMLLLISIYSLAILARVIVRVPAGGAYGAGLAPVPLLLFVYMFGANLPIFHVSEAAALWRRRAVLLLFTVGLTATMGVFAFRQLKTAQFPLSTSRGDLRLVHPLTTAISQALDYIASHSNPGEYLLVLPEGSSINFLTGRPVPVRYEIITPGFLGDTDERIAIRQLEEKNVRFIFLLNRPTSEFGPVAFGRDYCRTLMGWIESNFEVAAVFGDQVTQGVQIGDSPFFIKCYRKKLSPQIAATNRLP